jgi:hypothetical protein
VVGQAGQPVGVVVLAGSDDVVGQGLPNGWWQPGSRQHRRYGLCLSGDFTLFVDLFWHIAKATLQNTLNRFVRQVGEIAQVVVEMGQIRP